MAPSTARRGFDSWHAICGDPAGDRVKGEEKCQDAARLKPRSARAMCTRSIRKRLKAQD
jgi:hypothetical protein